MRINGSLFTQLHTYTRANTHEHMYTHIHLHTNTLVHTFTNTHTHTHVHTHSHTHIHTHSHTHVHTHTYTYIYTHIHTRTHVHTNTHIHTYTYAHKSHRSLLATLVPSLLGTSFFYDAGNKNKVCLIAILSPWKPLLYKTEFQARLHLFLIVLALLAASHTVPTGINWCSTTNANKNQLMRNTIIGGGQACCFLPCEIYSSHQVCSCCACQSLSLLTASCTAVAGKKGWPWPT